MGQLIDGKWVKENIITNHDNTGLYYKRDSVFRSSIQRETHRATLMRTLKHLEPFVTLTNTFQEPSGEGWSFGEQGHIVPGTDRRVRWLHELYTIADPACTTRVTVPTLWDAKTRRVVNN